MKFFLDANMPRSALKIFEELKLEAQHAKNVGLARADDREIIEYSIRNRSILITKDLEFGNAKIFPTEQQQGLIILRLPFYFTATQITYTLKNLLMSVDENELEKAITIVKLGRYRTRKFK